MSENFIKATAVAAASAPISYFLWESVCCMCAIVQTEWIFIKWTYSLLGWHCLGQEKTSCIYITYERAYRSQLHEVSLFLLWILVLLPIHAAHYYNVLDPIIGERTERYRLFGSFSSSNIATAAATIKHRMHGENRANHSSKKNYGLLNIRAEWPNDSNTSRII